MTPTDRPVLVTGPTGTVGGPLLDLLAAGGTPVVAGVRDPGRVLADPGAHAGQAYTLTGPEALDYHEVASVLSVELGRVVVYRPQGLLAHRRELLGTGLPSAFVTVQVVINLVARLGLAGRVTDTLGRLLGRPPTTLATYVHDRRDRWTAPV